VVEKSINSIVRESAHGWIEEHGGGLYSRSRGGLLSCSVAGYPEILRPSTCVYPSSISGGSGGIICSS
jgi:hypothetical protein